MSLGTQKSVNLDPTFDRHGNFCPERKKCALSIQNTSVGPVGRDVGGPWGLRGPMGTYKAQGVHSKHVF